MSEPVFVHSWWRASSTYVWGTFRRLPDVVAYYEPFHEFLALTDRGRVADVIGRAGTWEDSFHSPMGEEGYFAEFAPLLRDDTRLPLMPMAVAYDQYFLGETATSESTRRWVQTLIDAADGRTPVLCFNRSLGRIAWLKRNFGGKHILLWREPAEQWAAMNILAAVYGRGYFIDVTMLVAGKARKSTTVKKAIGKNAPPLLSDTTIEREIRWAGLIAQQLPTEVRFEAFVGTLVGTMAENLAAIDLVVDVSDLSAGRTDPAKAAGAIGELTGMKVDFSDFANEVAWRRDSATQTKAVGHVLNRLTTAQRSALIGAIEAQAEKKLMPRSKSLWDLRHRAEAVANRVSRPAG